MGKNVVINLENVSEEQIKSLKDIFGENVVVEETAKKRGRKKSAPKPEAEKPKEADQKPEEGKKKLSHEEWLEKTYGSKEDRTRYIQIKNQVAKELAEEARKTGKYMPKKRYMKKLAEETQRRLAANTK